LLSFPSCHIFGSGNVSSVEGVNGFDQCAIKIKENGIDGGRK